MPGKVTSLLVPPPGSRENIDPRVELVELAVESCFDPGLLGGALGNLTVDEEEQLELKPRLMLAAPACRAGLRMPDPPSPQGDVTCNMTKKLSKGNNSTFLNNFFWLQKIQFN